MNKSRFIELLKDPNKVLEKDLSQITELSGQYPFCQALHILKAKGYKKLDHQSSQAALHKAAAYCGDRKVLKTVIEENLPISQKTSTWGDQEGGMTANFDWIDQELTDDATKGPAEEATEEQEIIESPENLLIDYEHEDPEVEEVSQELQGENNGHMEGVSERELETPIKETEIPQELAEESHQDQLHEEAGEESASEEAVVEETGMEETEIDEAEIDEASPQSLQSPEGTEATEAEPEAVTEAAGPEETQEDSLDLQIAEDINEKSIHEELMDNLTKLQESRQQFRENPDFQTDATDPNEDEDGKKEQIEIIDNFIKNSPLLSKPNLSADSEATSQKDLSKKSAVFHDDMASEQLAKILIKQGNKKDAIKIYEKLIRKFPKKKSYFAGQIENLSKK